MIRINLLPHKKVKPVDKSVMRLQMALAALTILCVAGMAATFFTVSGRLSDLQEKSDSTKKELDVLKAKVKEVDGYEKSREEYKNKITVIDDLQKKRAFLTPFFNEVNKAMIKSVWLVSLSENEGAFTISAMCKESKDNAVKFANSLKNSQLLENVQSTDPKQVDSGSAGVSAYSFQVTGNIVGIQGAPAPAPPPAKPAKGGKGGKPAKGKK